MAALWNRINTFLLLLVLFVLLAMMAMLATRVRGGSLDPDAPPASTMKTLDEIPGSWSRRLPADDGSAGPDPPAGCNSSRFQCVFDNFGVLDRDTGLVLHRFIDFNVSDTWAIIARECKSNALATGRKGWRLPTIEEAMSLMDGTTHLLPAGHPFTNVTSAFFWTATTSPDNPAQAFVVNPETGGVHTNFDKTFVAKMWCVRGTPTGDGL